MRAIPKVTQVEHLGGHRLRLVFDDGLVREIDFAGQLEGEMFEPMHDEGFFAEVVIDPVTNTVTWPNDVDIDAEVLHGDADPNVGEPLSVIAEYRVNESA